jgi:hypothetical protein
MNCGRSAYLPCDREIQVAYAVGRASGTDDAGRVNPDRYPAPKATFSLFAQCLWAKHLRSIWARACCFKFFPINSKLLFEFHAQRRWENWTKQLAPHVRSGAELPGSVTCHCPTIHAQRGVVETPRTGSSYFVQPYWAEWGTAVVIRSVQHHGIRGRFVAFDFGRDLAHVFRAIRRDSLCGCMGCYVFRHHTNACNIRLRFLQARTADSSNSFASRTLNGR